VKRVCDWLAGAAAWWCTPAVVECTRWHAAVEEVCTTVTTTVCDAAGTVSKTVCDATATVSRTVCDATATVTKTICDSWGSIPIIGGLICLFARTVSSVVCTVSRVVSEVVCTASHVVAEVICTATRTVTSAVCSLVQTGLDGVCAVWTVVKSAGCSLVTPVARFACQIAGSKPGPIIRSATREVPSVPRAAASARSFVLGSDLATADLRAPYDEEGLHISYRLVDGQAEWALGGGGFAPLTPHPARLPPFAGSPPAGSLSATYDRRRLGEWSAPPRLDMIAAGGDRAIAKREGTDELFILVVADPYVHLDDDGKRQLLPQSYFKLDPELGQATARIPDLLAHVRIPRDGEHHPATERFPLFRKMFEIGTLTIRLPAAIKAAFGLADIDVRLFSGLSELGLVQEMDAQFPPRVWQKVDLRPPRRANEPPPGYPTYEHIAYASDDAFEREHVRHSVSFRRVLDLGVGLSHLHEQHDNRFGGELDNLSDKLWNALGVIDLPISDERAYMFANGPIRDYGGWVDGTCIYYLLVQLRPVDGEDPASLKDAFAILWADEQTAFTERWRVLALDDNAFNSPFKPMVGVLPMAGAAARFYPEAPFEVSRFWSPFAAGHVLESSRMAVTRQIVLVSGRDPATGAAELYSIHFSWPTMDRTWRWRAFPEGADPSSLQIREDSTIVLRGSRAVGRETVRGRFAQRYLPADGQEQPSVAARAAEPAGTGKPATGYGHPWRFLAEEPFEAMHRQLSHLGVLEPVHSRVQCYRVALPEGSERSREAIEAAVWEDAGHRLAIEHDRLDWAAAAAILDGGDARMAVSHRAHPSIYNDPLAFRLAQRPGLGWILMHFDKRDDKLGAFDGVGTAATSGVLLRSRDDPRRTITVSLLGHLRNDVRALHGRTVAEEADAVSPPQVRSARLAVTTAAGTDVAAVEIVFDLARDPGAPHPYASFAEWAAVNGWRVKLGAMIAPKPGAALAPVLLLDLERAVAFRADSATRFSVTWKPGPADQRDGQLAGLLSEAGAVRHGTSLWFVGATGLACCADETRFEAAAAA
jgi:hypothetical protein